MSGKILFNEHRTVHFGVIPLVLTDGSMDGFNFPLAVRTYDLLLPVFATQHFYVPGGVMGLPAILGYQSLQKTSEMLLGNDVINVNPPTMELLDDRYYRNFLHSVFQFGDVISQRQRHSPSSKGEHALRHHTFDGIASIGSLELPYETVSDNYLGISYQARHNIGGFVSRVDVTQLDPLTASPSYQWFGYDYHTTDITGLLSSLVREGTIEHPIYDGSPRILSLSDVSFGSSDGFFALSYHMRVQTFPTPGNGMYSDDCHWDSYVVVPLFGSTTISTPQLGIAYTSPFSESTFSYRNGRNDHPDNRGPLEFTWTSPYKAVPILLSNPSSSVSSLDTVSASSPGLNRLLANFRDAVDYSYYDLAASSIFSSVAAFEQLEGSLGTNVLQDLQKLPDIASALPRIKEAVHVLSRIVKRDVSLGTLKEIFDLATSTRLQADFQWRPFLDLLIDYLPRLHTVLSAFSSPRAVSIGRGSYHFEFPQGEFGRYAAALTTRSKIVIDFSSSGLLSAILGVDALGLLPKPSNIWDLIPFTFVVNWFTGVGQSIRRIEYSLLLADLPAYFVHTYTLTSPLTDKELDELGISSDYLSERLSLRLYYRDISHFSPVVRDTRFGFGIPTRLPPLGTLASLLYQLIFS